MGRLLDLVRKLIDYGKELTNTVRHRVATEPGFAKCAFGSSDLSLILARIARGLHLANALEARLVQGAKRLDRTPVPAQVVSPPRRRAPRDPASAPALPRLPTPGRFAAGLDPAVAAWVRHRPIGAVIADICRDLGILPSHPLWRELSDVIIRHGGSLARLVKSVLDRAFPLAAAAMAPAASRNPAAPAPAGTGPPAGI